jgi:hypothetical protein
MPDKSEPNRRAVLAGIAGVAAAISLSPGAAQPASPIGKPIPSTGERIPCVGLGSWITFNVGNDILLRDECAAVMGAFFHAGGRLIDSSPMYGSAQAVIGYGLDKLGRPPALFAADKAPRLRVQARSRHPGISGESGGSISCRFTICSPGRITSKP